MVSGHSMGVARADPPGGGLSGGKGIPAGDWNGIEPVQHLRMVVNLGNLDSSCPSTDG